MVEPKQCKIDTHTCDKAALDKLFKYQDTIIEHRDPFGQAAIEAIGDIFRDLTKSVCFVDKEYINSKINILKMYGHESGMDALEKCNYYTKNKATINKGINEWYPKLEEFKKVVKDTKMKDSCRKEILLEIPEIMQEIVKSEGYLTGVQGLKKIFKKFIKKLEDRL